MREAHPFLAWLFEQRDAVGVVAAARRWCAADRCTPTDPSDGLTIVKHIVEQHVVTSRRPLPASDEWRPPSHDPTRRPPRLPSVPAVTFRQARAAAMAIAQAWDEWERSLVEVVEA